MQNNNTRYIFKYLLIVLLIYIFIHNPILAFLGDIGSVKILYLLPILFIILKNGQYKLTIKTVSNEVKWLYILFFYISIRTLLRDSTSLVPYTSFVALIEEVFVPIALVCILEDNGFSFDDFIRVLLIVGAIGGVISVGCLLNSDFNQFVSTIFSVSSGKMEKLDYRRFGISDSLLFSYGIIQGFLFSLGLMYYRQNKWIIFFLPLMLLSALINARTGFIVCIIGILLSFRNFIKNGMLFFVMVVLSIFYIAPYFFNSMSNETVVWISFFFDELFAIGTGNIEDTGTVQTLIGRMWVMPDNFSDWIFGRGFSIFGGGGWRYGVYKSSDVGWILQLNLGGVIYLLLWSLFFLSILKKTTSLKIDKKLLLLIIFTIMIANTKGDMLSNAGSFRLILLILYYFLYKEGNSAEGMIMGKTI